MYTLNETEVHAVCYGVDLYNQCLTGGVSKTLNNRATDADHVPCVLIRGGCTAYGFEPGAARRMNPEQRISKEIAPTLREHMGDNQLAVAVIYDARGNGGAQYAQQSQENIRTESRTTQRLL